MEHLAKYEDAVKNLDAQDIIHWAFETFGKQHIALASSFSMEDQILTQMLVNIDSSSRILTLDTGRHFQETYDVWQKSVEHWNISYEVGSPEATEVARLVEKQGPNLFYNSIDQRKSCCVVRKTHPLKKLLSTVNAWIVGLRSEQSITRAELSPVEWDHNNGIYRISPLYSWSETETTAFIKKHNLPVSELYEKGFRSIGCAPCTRATGNEEDVRAGRWWWEEPEHRECGLHNRSNIGGK